MTPHLTDEETLMAAYGETVRTHDCPECAGRVEALRAELAALDPDEVPEPSADWEQRAWSRLAPELTSRRGSSWRFLAAASAVAASIVVAFLLGRQFPQAPLPGPSVATKPSEPARDRILLLAAGDHLERTQLLLVEVMNAEDGELPRERARELVSSSRLVRQAAAGAGETGIADTLDELERVLVEIAQTPRNADAGEVAALHRRIQGRSLLFKVRVLGSQLREESAPRPAVARKTTSSL